jgi:MFS family permease
MMVVLAALSMVATLPGRTVGLGLITEGVLVDLNLGRERFALLNLVATLLGSAFAVTAGHLTDRFGIRVMLAGILLLLGASVLTMSQMVTASTVAIFLIITRGLGQSALSTVSVTTLGKWFHERLAWAMGVFSVLVAIGFSAVIVLAQANVAASGWRVVWWVIGASIVGLGLLCALLARREPRRSGLNLNADSDPVKSVPFRLALSHPCFWVFGVSMALYSGVLAGVSLFNEAISRELGFGATTFRYAMAGLMSAGLVGNLVAAWAAQRFPLSRLVAIILGLLSLVLLGYAYLDSAGLVIIHASLFGFCGGVFSVIYFTGFGRAFGPEHLGKIQGCAQVMTVVASALGPWCLARVWAETGSYFPLMSWVAPAFALMAVWAWMTQMPSRES